MIKYNVSYYNFEDKVVKETLYFNLSSIELSKMQAKYGDIESRVNEMVKNEDQEALIDLFSDIIVMAYGERSEDGRKFVKTKEVQDNFRDSLAYNAFLEEMLFATGEKKLEEFMYNLYKPASKELQKRLKDVRK